MEIGTINFGNISPQSVGTGLLAQAAVANAQAEFMVQNSAVNRNQESMKQQQQMGHAELEMSTQELTHAENELHQLLAAIEKAAAAKKSETIFGAILAAFSVFAAILVGQPEIAVVSIAMLVAQKMGLNKELEKLSPGAAIGIGIGIIALSALAGGVGGAARDLGTLRTVASALMTTSTALPSVGLSQSVQRASGSQTAGEAMAFALMGVSFVLGLGSGAAMGASAKSLSCFGKFGVMASKASMAGSALSMAGESGSGFASGAYDLYQGKYQSAATQSRSLVEFCNEIRQMGTTQGAQYSQAMTAIESEAGKEANSIARGMADVNQFASHAVSAG